MPKPTVGRFVSAVVDPRMNNGEDVAPGLVTKVVESEDGETTVNLRVFLDTGADHRYTGVQVHDKRPTDDGENLPFDNANRVAFWPARS